MRPKRKGKKQREWEAGRGEGKDRSSTPHLAWAYSSEEPNYFDCLP